MYNWVLQCHNWLCLAYDCLGKRHDPCPLKLNWAPICPGFNSQRPPFAIPYSADAIPLSDSLVAIPSLHDRAPTIMFGVIFHRHRSDTKLAAGRPDKDHKIYRRILFGQVVHPAGNPTTNPTVRQLPGAIAITELSIPCHLESSCQLVDVAGSRRLRQRSIAISSKCWFDLFREPPRRRERENGPAKNVNNLKKCARGTRVASLFNRS